MQGSGSSDLYNYHHGSYSYQDFVSIAYRYMNKRMLYTGVVHW